MAIVEEQETELQAEKRRRERFSDLIGVSFHNNPTAAAGFLGVVENTIKYWSDGTHSPRPRRREKILLQMGLTYEALDLGPVAWAELLQNIPAQIARRIAGLGPPWMYTGGQVQILEENVQATGQVVLITDDAYNDTQIPEIYELVEANLRRGVNYLYVIPEQCPNRDRLVELVRVFRKRLGTIDVAGQVNVMCVPGRQQMPEWRFIDHVLLLLKEQITAGAEAFDAVDVTLVQSCFEQAFKPGEMDHGDHVWLKCARRKDFAFVTLLRGWAPASEWL